MKCSLSKFRYIIFRIWISDINSDPSFSIIPLRCFKIVMSYLIIIYKNYFIHLVNYFIFQCNTLDVGVQCTLYTLHMGWNIGYLCFEDYKQKYFISILWRVCQQIRLSNFIGLNMVNWCNLSKYILWRR